MKLEPWRVIDSQYLIDDRWLRLRADRCETATGDLVHPYYVFEYPSWVVVFPVTSRGELVLVRQYRHAIGRMFLELPGGRFDAGDTDAALVARRELQEETGYTGGTFEAITALAPDAARQNNFTHVVVATGLEHTCLRQLGHAEEVEVVTIPLQSVSAEVKGSAFAQATHVAAIYLGLAHLQMIR